MHRMPILLIFAFVFIQCQSSPESDAPSAQFTDFAIGGEFQDYWYNGQAELNSYDLSIIRYGEARQGQSVLVFVTEDFSSSKQVKLDDPEKNPADKVPVLKLNAIQKFQTGIYDYSMMLSVFTPTDLQNQPRTLKTTCTSQDWCGHTFTQVNAVKEGFRVNLFSYFESEGDQDYVAKVSMLEDELFTRLRINPQSIPAGTFDLLPGMFYTRLSHDQAKPKAVRARQEQNGEVSRCVIEFLHLDRTLTIDYETAFPRRILGWKEVLNGQTMVEARLNKSIRSPYWQQNSNEFDYMRDSLGLVF